MKNQVEECSQKDENTQTMPLTRKYILTGLVLVAIAVGAVFFARAKFRREFIAQAPAVNLKIKGLANAPVTIEVFSDFECPACRFALAEEAKILGEFPDQVRFIFYHFPLSSHRLSPLAHQAAECAALQGRFWPYHDRLYEKQAEWTVIPDPTQTLMEFARDEGMDLDRFAVCLADRSVTEDVKKDRNYGEALQIRSTPTFFVNGERFVGAVELAKGGVEKIRKILGKDTQPGSL